MRLFLAVALLPALASAAILPDTIGTFKRHDPMVQAWLSGPDDLWKELGLKDKDSTSYVRTGTFFSAAAYQLSDPTAALAAFYWQRPAASKPSKAAPLAAETPDSLLLVHGNYLLSFTGYKPSKPELEAVLGSLPNVDRSSLPTLYLPETGRVPNSERYITGPAALQAFLPGIPASAAGLQSGGEAQTAVFHSPKGDATLAIFNYPTPQIAMKQLAEFEKAGLTVHRSVSLIAATLPGAESELAQNLLTQIQFHAQVTVPEHIPTLRDNIGNLVINAFVLIGILLAITLVAGLSVGAMRAYQRRGGRDPDADTIVSLHLQ